MESDIKLKTYSAMADTTRKWVTVMDAKSAFISTLNAGLLTFIWTGAKLTVDNSGSCCTALLATIASFFSLVVALIVILPKFSLKSVFGKKVEYKSGFKPISFYGFVAENYSNTSDAQFINDVKKMDEEALAVEALEQHFIISHIVQRKSKLLLVAGGLFFLALVLTVISLVIQRVA